MTRAYLRLDPGFADRKRHYPDGPYRALIDVFCAAEDEPHRGTFRSMAVLRAVIGRSARHLPFLFGQHDLRLLPDGRVEVVGWDEWQEGDWKVAERVRRIRDRRESIPDAAPDVTVATVTDDTPQTVSTLQDRKPLAVSGKRSATEETPADESGVDFALWTRIGELAEELTRVPYALPSPYSGLGAQALDQTQAPDVTWAIFEATYRKVAQRHKGRPSARQLVFEAEDILRPINHAVGREAAVEERAADNQAAFDQRVQATLRRNEHLRGDA